MALPSEGLWLMSDEASTVAALTALFHSVLCVTGRAPDLCINLVPLIPKVSS